MFGPNGMLAWTPWAQTISEEKHEQIMEARGGRIPRTDHEILAALTHFDLPRSGENDISGSPYFVENLLKTRRNAFALCRACHLQSHKLLDNKFMSLYTQKVDPKLGRRKVNINEAMEADRRIMNAVYAQASEPDWTLNDAFYEFATARADINTLLQPRPLMCASTLAKAAIRALRSVAGQSPAGALKAADGVNPRIGILADHRPSKSESAAPKQWGRTEADPRTLGRSEAFGLGASDFVFAWESFKTDLHAMEPSAVHSF